MTPGPTSGVTPGPAGGPTNAAAGGFGIYVHVPFCAARCDYCAFATWTDRDALMAAYVDACLLELRRAGQAEDLPAATSVYVGGGTPSRLAGESLGALVGAVVRHPGAEVTVECNPEDASAELLDAWAAAGVTRVSFGVQSLVPRVLGSLGRRHGPGHVARAVALASQAGIGSLSVDLILGAAAETDGDLAATVEGVLALHPRPGHVSAYALTVEPGTALARDRARHPDDDVVAGRYAMVDALLTDAGYRWYEVSNWAVPGEECRHNQLYWAQGDYRGIGCAAHSHRAGRRWWNVRTPERYIAAVTSGRDACAGEEVLGGRERAFEALALGLRTSAGVPAAAVPDAPELDGLVERRGGRARLTVRGRLLANEVTVRLLADGVTGRPGA